MPKAATEAAEKLRLFAVDLFGFHAENPSMRRSVPGYGTGPVQWANTVTSYMDEQNRQEAMIAFRLRAQRIRLNKPRRIKTRKWK